MNTLTESALSQRHADYDIEDLILQRWSPRAMAGQPLPESELLRLFEAARWAPSTYNEQEWRFIYAHRETESWHSLFDLLAEANQAWCQAAAVLIVVVSHKVFERNGKPNRVHSFDAGAAFQNIALQGAAMGLVVHGMAGFDYEAARTTLEVPDDYDIEAMIAVGLPGDRANLSEELREREQPSGRKPVRELISEGRFGKTCSSCSC